MSSMNTTPIPPLPQQPMPPQQPPSAPSAPATSSTRSRVNTTLLIVGAVLYVVYLAAVFLFWFPIMPVAWMSIVFATLAFGLTFIVPAIVKGRPVNEEAVFFGIPLAVFASYYFFAETVLSLLFIIFQWIVPFGIAFFLQLLLLAAFIIAMVVGFTTQRTSAQRSEERHMEARAWNLQAVDVRSIQDAARTNGASPQLVAALDHLAETIQYSDPFTRQFPAVQAIEQSIAMTMAQLQQASMQRNEPAQLQLVAQLEQLYAQRSRTLMQLK